VVNTAPAVLDATPIPPVDGEEK